MIFKTLALAAITIWLAVLALPDNKLHLVVCDVGQGDAILVTYKTTQMLIDGGPNKAVLECLARHMPFYDRRIEVVLLTHPQADHLNGLIEVLKRYTVLRFERSDVENNTDGFRELMGLNVGRKVYAGDEIRFMIHDLRFKILWPKKDLQSEEINDYSIVGKLSFGDFDALLTGDAGTIAPATPVEVLKVPHHGSKYGMTKEWLEATGPRLAIISVGKRNSYGHPAADILKILSDEGIKILRTDLDGDVEIVSDGKKYWVNRGL